MPSSSPAQKRTMAALAHGWHPPAGSKVAKIPLSVALEFHQADRRKAKGLARMQYGGRDRRR